jgi:hypothetical protein
MRVAVDFQGESLEFEVPEERVVARWRGPEGLDRSSAAAAIEEALEHPRDFPAFRQLFVPGDRVAIALDPEIPQADVVLGAIVEVLGRAGVESETLTIVCPAPAIEESAGAIAPAAPVEIHDPDDRARIAYLASTRDGRRVYLNRSITDADVVVPVGLLRYDSDVGYRGPWSVLFPGLSDRQTMRSLRNGPGSGIPEADRGRRAARLEEASEVTWLLGSQFYFGIVPAARGILEVVAGLDAAVRSHGIDTVDRNWTMTAPEAAELVVAGVGGSSVPATLADLAAALETASGLVRRGGRIVVLSRATGAIGPALQRLSTVEEPGEALAALRGLEEADDYSIARRIAAAAAWADLFVASGLDAEFVEGLSIAPLERPEQARRLAANAGSVTFVSRAELTRARVETD